MNSMQQLWERLKAGGVVSGEMPVVDEVHAPLWFVRVMLGISGWIAASFLLGFLAAGLSFVIEEAVAAITVGALFMAAAYLLFRFMARNDFFTQFALALSFAGQALFMFGLFQLLKPEESLLWWIIAAMQGLLALLMPSFIHRVWSAWAAVTALVLALAIMGAFHLAAGIVAATVALIWLNELRWPAHGELIRPIGYGVTLALLQIEGQGSSPAELLSLLAGRGESLATWLQPWLGELLTGVALLVVVWQLLGRIHPPVLPRNRVAVLLATVIIAALSLKAPGIAAGLMVVLLGFAGGNRALLGVGIAALLFYISIYYYQMETTLLVKSGVLALTGLVLLTVRWWLLRSVGNSGQGHHA